MKSKTMILMVVAIGCGLAASYMTSRLLAERADSKDQEQEKVTIVVAKQNLSMGTLIKDPERFVIGRERPRQHLSFGYGIHRCVGLRLAELQLKIVWQEILRRFDRINVVDQPKRVYSSFIKGYETLPVQILR